MATKKEKIHPLAPEPENVDNIPAPPKEYKQEEDIQAPEQAKPIGEARHAAHPSQEDAVPEVVDEITADLTKLLSHGNSLTTYIAERVQYSSYAIAVHDANDAVGLLQRALDMT